MSLVRSPLRSLIRSFISSPLVTKSGFLKTLANWSTTGATPEAVVTSPKMSFGDDILSDTAITVATGLTYSLDGGAYTGDAGTRGIAKTIRFRLTASAEYETLVSKTATIGVAEYTIAVTTMTEVIVPGTGFPYTLPFEVA